MFSTMSCAQSAVVCEDNKVRVRKRIKPTHKMFRSAITNGGRLLAGIDGRSHTYRRFRDLYQFYMSKTDGRNAELCKQLASLIVQREALDADVMRGKHVDPFHFVRIVNATNRTLGKLQIAKDDPDKLRRRRRREDREAGLTA